MVLFLMYHFEWVDQREKPGYNRGIGAKLEVGRQNFLEAFGKFYEQNWRFLQFLKACGGGLGPPEF